MITLPELDDLQYEALVKEARSLIPTLSATWTDHNPSDPGIMLIELFAWLSELVGYRLNQVTDEAYWNFLDLLNGPDKGTESTDLAEAIRQSVTQLRLLHRAVSLADYRYLTQERWPESETGKLMGPRAVVPRFHFLGERNLEVDRDARAPGHISMLVMADLPVVNFDGTDDYVSCTNGLRVQVVGDLTISAWIYPRWILKGRQILIMKDSGHEFKLTLEADGSLVFSHGNGMVESFSHPNFYALVGRWSYVTVTRSMLDRRIRFYLHGQEVGNAAFTITPTASSQDVWVGGRPDADAWFDGLMLDMCVWSVARSANTLINDPLRTPQGDETGLEAWMCDGQLPMRVKTTTSALDGTFHGAEWTAQPNGALLDGLTQFLNEWKLLGTQLHLVGPSYVGLKLSANLYLVEGAIAADVKDEAEAALRRFLNEYQGGKDGKGWPFGRNLYYSDLYALLDTLSGIDFVTGLSVSPSLTDNSRLLYTEGSSTGSPSEQNGIRLEDYELPLVSSITLTTYELRGNEWQVTP